MSLKVPCKHCGKEISLRKMPNGKFVPFDKWTNTQHRCQDQPAETSGKSAVSTNPQSHVGAGTSVGDLVFRVVSESPGLKAKHIASTISRKYGVNVDRSEVNRWLYNDLKKKVYQDESYQWLPGNAPIGSPQRPSVRSGMGNTSHDRGGIEPQGGIPEYKTELAKHLQSGSQDKSNKMLWGIILLLVVIVLILFNK